LVSLLVWVSDGALAKVILQKAVVSYCKRAKNSLKSVSAVGFAENWVVLAD
jgi:hypothetical protein